MTYDEKEKSKNEWNQLKNTLPQLIELIREYGHVWIYIIVKKRIGLHPYIHDVINQMFCCSCHYLFIIFILSLGNIGICKCY